MQHPAVGHDLEFVIGKMQLVDLSSLANSQLRYKGQVIYKFFNVADCLICVPPSINMKE